MEKVEVVNAISREDEAARAVVDELRTRGYFFLNPEQALEIARLGVLYGQRLERGA